MPPGKGIAQNKIDFCKVEDNTLKLKQNHNCFYQVQGQLHITCRNYCYFVVWSPKGLLYENIIMAKIEPKYSAIDAFYHK